MPAGWLFPSIRSELTTEEVFYSRFHHEICVSLYPAKKPASFTPAAASSEGASFLHFPCPVPILNVPEHTRVLLRNLRAFAYPIPLSFTTSCDLISRTRARQVNVSLLLLLFFPKRFSLLEKVSGKMEGVIQVSLILLHFLLCYWTK